MKVFLKLRYLFLTSWRSDRRRGRMGPSFGLLKVALRKWQRDTVTIDLVSEDPFIVGPWDDFDFQVDATNYPTQAHQYP